MDLVSSSLLVLLTFLGCYAEQDVLPEGPVDVVLGRNVTLKTLLDKPNYLFIIWNFNDGKDQVNVATQSTNELTVNPNYQGRVSVNATNGNLFLQAVQANDSGDYSITVVSDLTKTGEIKLRVLEPVIGVTIKSNLAEAIEHNSTVILTCSAKGSFLNFTWTNRTNPLTVDGKRIKMEEGKLSSTLTITGVLRWDLLGPIYCTAANKLESERTAPFNLTVYYGPDQVTITPQAPPQFIKSGSDFNLTCSSVSSPAATFHWFHNQKLMENSGPVLTLKKIQEHKFGRKAGEYTCGASNDKTKRTVASAAVSFAVIDPVSGVKITGPTAVLLAGNSTANISCQAAAGDVTTRAWLKDGKPLTAGGRMVFAKNMSSLLIDPLQKEDNGEYTCQLGNPVGQDRASYKMVVNYGPEAAAVMGEKAVEVNDKVMLTCVAPSVPPANFTWKFNGTVTDIKTATYAIENAMYKNMGTYTCEAHNGITGKTVTSTHNLSVKEEGSLDGLSDGAIAGIIIAVLVAVGAAIGLFLYCRQKVPVESPY